MGWRSWLLPEPMRSAGNKNPADLSERRVEGGGFSLSMITSHVGSSEPNGTDGKSDEMWFLDQDGGEISAGGSYGKTGLAGLFAPGRSSGPHSKQASTGTVRRPDASSHRRLPGHCSLSPNAPTFRFPRRRCGEPRSLKYGNTRGSNVKAAHRSRSASGMLDRT